MKEYISIRAAESAMLVIGITDRMVSDYRECKRLSKVSGGDGKNCHGCNLDTSADFNFGLCELPVVMEAIERRGDDEIDRSMRPAGTAPAMSGS